MDKEKVAALQGLLERKEWVEDILEELHPVMSRPDYSLRQFVEVRIPTAWLEELYAKAKAELEEIGRQIEEL